MKNILHLCADIGSDSYPYQCDPKYNVILIGKTIGVENFHPDRQIYGVIANPVCTEYSIASGFHKKKNINTDILMHCQRIIKEAKPKWWAIENPSSGRMKEILGPPDYVYEPWFFGSPWTKKTALWGVFNKPTPIYTAWQDVAKNNKLYTRPGRPKPSLAFMHKSAIYDIPEFEPFIDRINTDADFRSLCSQGFAKCFYQLNK